MKGAQFEGLVSWSLGFKVPRKIIQTKDSDWKKDKRGRVGTQPQHLTQGSDEKRRRRSDKNS